MRQAWSLVVVVLAAAALAGCKSASCASTTVTQNFSIPTGATRLDVPVDLSRFAFGSTLGVPITHGDVILMTAATEPVRDACTALSIGDWAVDAALAPQD